jgi:glycosyltransferase involved in cell wall biosynthesis
MDELRVSVALISWNQLEFLKRLVSQLLDQEFDHTDYEIVIADDGSTDGSQEWLSALHEPRIRPLLSQDRSNRAQSRNKAIRESRGDIVIMVDGDHTVKRDFLSIHAERHASEKCAIVGKSDFVHDWKFRALNRYLNNCGAAKLPPNERLPGRYFLTRNCSVPRDVLLEIGLFDESFPTWGGEDLELGVRLEDSGIPIYGEPRALAIHHHLRAMDQLLENLYSFGKLGVPLLVEKHPRLFRELKLDLCLRNPYEANHYGALTRALVRALFSAPIYGLVKFKANFWRSVWLPRFIFDYLHVRQYTLGYLDRHK